MSTGCSKDHGPKVGDKTFDVPRRTNFHNLEWGTGAAGLKDVLWPGVESIGIGVTRALSTVKGTLPIVGS